VTTNSVVQPKMRVIGVMSGTSYDAIDAAAADIWLDGEAVVVRPLGLVSTSYSTDLRNKLAAALPPATTSLAAVCQLDTEIGQAFAELAGRANGELCQGTAELIASHGQTVFHWIEQDRVKGTLQIGQPAWIAEHTGCAVVSDFRPRDVAAGGQGAPLVSIVDTLWLQGRPGVPVSVNLGGIANITVVRAEPVAFDTGPANALIDAAVTELTSGAQSFDADGRMGAAGQIHPNLLQRLLAEPYYQRSAPKSTGKELFHGGYLKAALTGLPPIKGEDLVATLTALTARTVAEAARAVEATELIVAGGGTKNPTLMSMLRSELPNANVVTSDELGLPSAAKEALAFAVLGFLTANGLPGTIPSCTGARHASVLGSITPGRNGWPQAHAHASEPTHLRIETA